MTKITLAAVPFKKVCSFSSIPEEQPSDRSLVRTRRSRRILVSRMPAGFGPPVGSASPDLPGPFLPDRQTTPVAGQCTGTNAKNSVIVYPTRRRIGLDNAPPFAELLRVMNAAIVA